MKNSEGGGEPGGWRRTERRAFTGWEGVRAPDRDSRETKLNVPFSIFERSVGTRAGSTAVELMIRVELHKD